MVEFNAKNTLFALVGVAVVILGLYGTGLLSLTGTPDCQFTEENKKCEYQVTLDNERVANQYVLTLEGDGVPGPISEEQSIEPIDKVQGTERDYDREYEEEHRTYWLFKSPERLDNKRKVFINADISVSGSADEYEEYQVEELEENEMYFSTDIFTHEEPYKLDNARVCSAQDFNEYCEPDERLDQNTWYTHHEYNAFGDEEDVSAERKAGMSIEGETTWDVESDEDNPSAQSGSNTFTLQATDEEPFFDKDLQLYQVELEARQQPPEHTSYSVDSTDFSIQYQRNSYPTNVAFNAPDNQIQLNGEVIDETDVDIASVVNELCQAPRSEECRANLVITSDKPGNLYIEEKLTATKGETPESSNPENIGDDEDSQGTNPVLAFFYWLGGLLTA